MSFPKGLDIVKDKVVDVPEETLERIRGVFRSYGFATQAPYKTNDWALVKDERYGWLIVWVLSEEKKSAFQVDLQRQEEVGYLGEDIEEGWKSHSDAGVFGEDKVFGFYHYFIHGFVEKWSNEPIEVAIANLSLEILFSDVFEFLTDRRGHIMRKGGQEYNLVDLVDVFHKDDVWVEGGEHPPVLTHQHERQGLAYDERTGMLYLDDDDDDTWKDVEIEQ